MKNRPLKALHLLKRQFILWSKNYMNTKTNGYPPPPRECLPICDKTKKIS